jgi:ABC-2 type transport system ATP-binding protein
VIVIHHGRILFDGDLSALSDQFAAHKTLVVTLREETVDLSDYGDVVDVTGPKVMLRVPRAATAAITARILSEQSVDDLTVEDPPIEDVIELAFASGVEG